jgi:hypothetical protein
MRLVEAFLKKQLEDRAIEFLKKNPHPEDSEVHALADELGVDKHRFEEVIYGLLGKALTHKEARVRKGQVRTTVLRQIHALKDFVGLLEDCIDLKKDEIREYKGEGKAKSLHHQVSIMEEGLKHIHQALKSLDKYKDVSTSS